MKTYKLPQLPYSKTALAPFLSEETFNFHYEKHHKAYIDKMNSLLPESGLADLSLEELMLKSTGGLFNQAAQSWNHTFYWFCMTPEKGQKPSAGLLAQIDKDFGSFEAFTKKFVDVGMGQFGSGWVWLCKNASGGLSVVPSGNAENPVKQGLTPILVSDVWEHAYYIDFRNLRQKYLETFCQHINWAYVDQNYKGSGTPELTSKML